jgi:hypothetical protein
MAKQEFKQGDRVQWETSQGTTHGKVVNRLTSDRAARLTARDGGESIGPSTTRKGKRWKRLDCRRRS